MVDLIGKTLGGYQIVEQIGRGGMATVYKAYQPSLDRDVAVKVLPPYYAEQDESFITRFRREARAIAKLRHPNILMVLDFGEKDEISYIIMEYVDAGTLKDRLKAPITLSEIYMLISQIANALDYAHSEGIVHRDIKPSNILMPKPDWTLLTDFGLAKMVGGSSMLTQSGMTVGTPAYMSPEQGSGKKIDARTDIYALGVMLYEMVVGEVPYIAETPMAVVVKHIVDPLPMPRAKNPDIPEELQRVILKALAKDPEDRFQKAGELVEAMETIAKTSPDWSATEIQTVTALRTEIEDRPSTKALTEDTAGVIPPTLSTSPAATKAVDMPKKRSSSWLIIAGVVMVGILVVGILQDPIKRMFSGGDNSANLAAESGDDEIVGDGENAGDENNQPGDEGFSPEDDEPLDDEFEFESPEDAFNQGRRFLELGDRGRAKRIFMIALDKAPELYGDLMGLVDEIYYNGDIELAIELIVDVAIPSQKELDPEAYEWVGWMYLEIGRPQQAQEFFTTIIINDPSYEDAYYGFFDAFIDEEWEAINILEGLKKEYPDEFNVYDTLGRLYNFIGEDEKAIENFMVAMEIRPDNPWMLIDAAQAYLRIGKKKEALDLVDQALEKAPDDGGIWEFAGWFYNDIGEYEKAADAFRRVIDLWPDNEWAYIGLLESLVILGKGGDEIPGLIKTAERLVMEYRDLWAMDSLAWIYYDIGDCRNAVRIFEMILEEDPFMGEAREGLDACKD